MYSALKIILRFLVTAIPDLLQYVCYAIAINLSVGIKRLHAINNIFNYLDNIFDMKLFLRILGLQYCLSEEILATDWIQILVTFRSTCCHCGKEVPPGKAFWSNSAKAAKHLRCKQTRDEGVLTKDKLSNEIVVSHNIIDEPHAPRGHSPQIIDLKCYICGAKTGCNKCSFLSECVHRFNSEEYCICKGCSSNGVERAGTYEQYKQIFVQNSKTEMNVSNC
jgi:hypothetical protein